MNKLILSAIGITLATGAVSAFAAKGDSEKLAQCRADIVAYYGEDTRARMSKIRRSVGETHMRFKVTPVNADGTVIVCSIAKDGTSSLANRDGVALTAQTDEQKVSLSQ